MAKFSVQSICERGRREQNEDSFWCSVFEVENNECAVACVCDGMGGLIDGKSTSQRIANIVREYCLTYGTISGIDQVILRESSNIYNEYANADKKSGTTCTVVFLANNEWSYYHIGDSRLYRYDVQKNKPFMVTVDHTVLNANKEKLEALDRADPATDPDAEEKLRRAHLLRQKYKNCLTRCLGVMEEPTLDSGYGNYHVGDRFLVCSDGFWHHLRGLDFNADRITNLQGLVEEFLTAGESDNLTAVLITVEG